MFNGKDLWHRADELRRHLEPAGAAVVIIGGGGTGAAIIAWLMRQGYVDRDIYLVAKQATIYMRADNVFDNRLFSDGTAWAALTPETQDAVFNRLNRGVVWAKSLREIEQARRLQFRDAKAVYVHDRGAGELEVQLSDTVTNGEVRGAVVIDAAGFDAWWFQSLLPADLKAIHWTDSDKKQLKAKLTDAFALNHGRLFKGMPPLHVPGISERRGPGFASLMALGAMSDRILIPYVAAA